MTTGTVLDIARQAATEIRDAPLDDSDWVQRVASTALRTIDDEDEANMETLAEAYGIVAAAVADWEHRLSLLETGPIVMVELDTAPYRKPRLQ